MTPAWTAKAARNLLPHSVAPVLADALREWAYTGQSNDYGQPEETCELCDQEDLRYHFEIGNAQTGHHLWVGSKCIQRFGMAEWLSNFLAGPEGVGHREDAGL